MRLTIGLLATALACGVVPRAVSAQSLGDVAAKEKERRSGKGGKVITESDLRGGDQSFETGDAAAEPAEGATEAAADSGTAPKEKSDDEKRSELQSSLQKQVDAELAQIENIKRDLAARETELADTSNYLIGGRREALLKYVDDAKQAIVNHEAQVEKLRAQARREGIAIR